MTLSSSDTSNEASASSSVTIEGLGLVAAGGAIGGLLRWGISELLTPLSQGFPWPTYLVNLLGSFCLGLLTGRLWYSPNENLRVFVGVGVLGGFTTFSTFALEVVRHASQGTMTTALVYAVGSVVACGIAAALGLVLTRPKAPPTSEDLSPALGSLAPRSPGTGRSGPRQ